MRSDLKIHLRSGAFGNVEPSHRKRMAAIRGKGNKSTEGKLRGELVRQGISGWKLQDRTLLGKPDFFFPAQKLAIFVDGCFWHGCLDCGHRITKNGSFWAAKLAANAQRDRTVEMRLRRSGFSVLRFWEHELRQDIVSCANRIRDRLQKLM